MTPVGNRDIAERRSCGEAEALVRWAGSVAAMRCDGKYDAARVRTPLALIAVALSALVLAACGSEGVSVSAADGEELAEGAEIFATHCAGCHTISAAGSQGSGNRGLRAQGPNFDQRVETYDEALFAIQNGGFSGAIMPQNIVVGDDAAKVAEFVAEYSGSEVAESDAATEAGETSEPGEGGEGAEAADPDAGAGQGEGGGAAPGSEAAAGAAGDAD